MTNTLVDFRASSLPKAEFGKFYTHFLKDFDDSFIEANCADIIFLCPKMVITLFVFETNVFIKHHKNTLIHKT